MVLGGRKDLGTAQWVGAVIRDAEGSLKQLPLLFGPAIGPSWGAIAASLRHRRKKSVPEISI
jgi:hypothetical protein